MANAIQKTMTESNNRFHQVYIIFDGTNSTNSTIIDASTTYDAIASSSLHDLTFIDAKWCLGNSTASITFKFKDTDTLTNSIPFFKIGSGSGRIELNIANSVPEADRDGDIIYTSTGSPIGFVILTFKKISGFTAIDNNYHSSELSSSPSLL